MLLQEKNITLKDGTPAVLRSPSEEDAKEMLSFIIRASGETEFLLKNPEEFADFSIEQEKAFLQGSNTDPNGIMIVCLVNGKIAGNCQITFRAGMKVGHRASVAIAILQEFWGLGIGTALFEEMIRIAKERGGVHQIELDFVEGNARARALYEKMGFRITGVVPDAIRLRDGSLVNEYTMVKRL